MPSLAAVLAGILVALLLVVVEASGGGRLEPGPRGRLVVAIKRAK